MSFFNKYVQYKRKYLVQKFSQQINKSFSSQGINYRRDIHSIQTNIPDSPTNFSYKDSGVDVENANSIVSSIQEKISETQMISRENAIVLSKLGDFSGLVKLKGNFDASIS